MKRKLKTTYIFTKNHYDYHISLFLLVFIAGLLNAQSYIVYMGFYRFNNMLVTSLYILLLIITIYFILSFLYKGNKISIYSTRYWILLVVVVVFKYFILILNNPSVFSNDSFYSTFVKFSANITIMLLLIIGLKGITNVKKAIILFGIAASFSAIIPLAFYPEYIGTRITTINGFKFTGAFWNASLISYISAGWLLFSISTFEKSKLKRNIYICLFLLLVLASLAGLSRASLLSLIMATLTYLIFSNKLSEYIRLLLVACAIGFILFIFFKEPIDNFQERLEREVNIEEEPRFSIWLDYLEDYQDFFLLGTMDGNHRKFSSTGQGPHSVLLNWLSQYGIFALMGYVFLILGLLQSIHIIGKHYGKQTSAALYAWLVSYLSVALINETGFSELTVFVAFGMLIAWGKQVRNHNQERTHQN